MAKLNNEIRLRLQKVIKDKGYSFRELSNLIPDLNLTPPTIRRAARGDAEINSTTVRVIEQNIERLEGLHPRSYLRKPRLDLDLIEVRPQLPIEEAIFLRSDGYIDARQIHGWLNVSTEYRHWIDRRIEQFNFLEGRDFQIPVSFDRQEKMANSPIIHLVTREMAFNLVIVDRTDKAAEARKYLIAVHDQARDQAKVQSEVPSLNEIFATLTQLLAKNSLDIASTQANQIEIKKDIVAIQAAVTPEAIDEKIKENLAARAARGVDSDHISAEAIADLHWHGMNKDNVGKLLDAVKHPRDKTDVMGWDGRFVETRVFRTEGLEEAIEEAHETITFVKNTPLKYKFTSPLFGKKRCFYITHEAFKDPRVAALWGPKIPKTSSNVTRMKDFWNE